MKHKDKGVSERSTKNYISTALYIAAALVALLGIAVLADNIYIFKSTLDQYLAQGYPTDTVIKSLLPQQLLPGIFEPIALYGGIAFVLIGVGINNKKISKCLLMLNKVDIEDYTDEENIIQEAVTDFENIETIEQTETDPEIKTS